MSNPAITEFGQELGAPKEKTNPSNGGDHHLRTVEPSGSETTDDP